MDDIISKILVRNGNERKKRNIMVVKNLIHNLNTTFSNAVELLGLPQQEIDEIKKYFQS